MIKKNEAPLVSVVIPIYKVEQYLEECVRSVMNQTYTNLEIILVDDESPDCCPNMCEAYKEEDSRVVVIHKKNGGLGSARNAGVRVAHGKYIEFLDSDDWILPNTIEYLVHEAEGKALDMVLFAATSFVDGNKDEINIQINQYNRSHNFDIVMDGITCYKKMLENREYIAQICMRFFSLSFYRKNGFRFQEGIIHEDEDIGFLSVVLANRIEIVNQRFYQRRYRPGSIMTAKSEIDSARGYAGAFAGLAEAYKQMHPSGELEELLLQRMTVFIKRVCNAYLQAKSSQKKEIRRKAQAFLKKGVICNVPMDKSLRIAEHSLLMYDWYLKYRKVMNTVKKR